MSKLICRIFGHRWAGWVVDGWCGSIFLSECWFDLSLYENPHCRRCGATP